MATGASDLISRASKNKPHKFPLIMRVLHWLIAAVIIILTIGGFYSTQISPGSVMAGYIAPFHRTVGTALLVLVTMRLICRLLMTIPKLPREFPKPMRAATYTAHYILYALMFLIPVSGFLIANNRDHGVKMYGLQLQEFFLPLSDKLAAIGLSLHALLAYGCITLVAIHVVAILWHRIVDHINVMHFMTFSFHKQSKAE